MDTGQTTSQEDRSFGGFLFYNQRDAALAESEQKKIEYLEERMDYSRPDMILKIYEKAVNQRIFVTPHGIFYLKGIRDYLLNRPEIDGSKIPPIPLFHTYHESLREEASPARIRVRPAAPEKKKGMWFPVSLILNVLLAGAVIAMFVITLQSENPNILNYERALTNRYAGWEQELTEREQSVREKERELKIETK